MRGKSALFWIGLTAAAGAVLFETSYEVQGLEEQLASLNHKIVVEQEAIQILKAEWSFLNDPTRLESLAREHLALKPIDARQFVALDIVPMRPVSVPQALPAPAPLPNAPRLAPAPAPMPQMAGVTGGTTGAAVVPAALKAPATKTSKPEQAKPAMVIPASIKSVEPERPKAARKTAPTEVASRPAQPALRPSAADDSLGALVARLEQAGQ
jgi:hypothetical protein